MKVRYNREMDIATIELSSKTVDHAQESQNIIVHFSKDNEPVVLEILDASDFLANVTRVTIKSKNDAPVKVSL